jgi:putative colanic acid biosynthesis glycosyltransferase
LESEGESIVKILQINIVYKEKSTGRTCFEVNQALENCGHKGYVAYGKGKHTDENTYRIGSDIEYYFHNIMARITGLQGYFSYFATRRLIKYIKQISPDIIHLRNLHANYLNLPELFRFLKYADIPVILNLHDCWAYTGKCPHYTDIQCYKWKEQCFDCPVIHNYPQSLFFDITKKLFTDKKRWFISLNDLTVVGVSKWTADQAKMSFLSDRRIFTIYNWINRNVFYPHKDNILSKYGIDSTKFTILGVSSSWTAGSPRYDDFMKISNLIHDDMQIVLVGQSSTSEWPKNIKHIPFISDINELAKLYSSADVYVHLSTEDSFGKVVAEAMACGTPTIVYNSTALPELIKEGCGYVVDKRDVERVVEAIFEIRRNGKNYYLDSCVSNVAVNFDYDHNTKMLIQLYESIIKENMKC